MTTQEIDVKALAAVEGHAKHAIGLCWHAMVKDFLVRMEMEKGGMHFMEHEQVRCYARIMGELDYMASITPKP